MRTFLVTSEEGFLAEGVEFSNGTVVVRWLASDAVSRFPDLSAVRDISPLYSVEPVREEPLPERLRRIRTEKGISQRALAREVGMSFSTISRIEQGKPYVMNPELERWLDENG